MKIYIQLFFVFILFGSILPAGVPVKFICKRHGIELSRDAYFSRFTMRRGGSVGYLGPGLAKVIINGREYALSSAPEYKSGRLEVDGDFERIIEKHFLKKTGYWQKVTIDPGHGGKDPGAISPHNGLHEKDVVLDVSKKVRDILEDNGVEVVMTRDDDTFVELNKRAQIANRSKSNFFASIHADACSVPSVTGVEVFYGEDWHESGIDVDSRAAFLAGAMNLNAFLSGKKKGRYTREEETFFFKLMLQESNAEGKKAARIVVNNLAEKLKTDNRGIKTKNLRVIRKTACPAILIEIGFLTNFAESERLRNTQHRKKVAEAIADSILKYLKQNVKK